MGGDDRHAHALTVMDGLSRTESRWPDVHGLSPDMPMHGLEHDRAWMGACLCVVVFGLSRDTFGF